LNRIRNAGAVLPELIVSFIPEAQIPTREIDEDAPRLVGELSAERAKNSPAIARRSRLERYNLRIGCKSTFQAIRIFFVFGLAMGLAPHLVNATTYYLRADGRASNKESATSDAAASTSMDVSKFDSEKSSMSSGDVIIVSDKGGTYTGESLDLDGLNGLTFRANSGGSPKFTNSDTIISMELTDNCVIDGLELEKSGGYVYGAIRSVNPGDNNTIKNCKIHGADDFGIAIGDDSTTANQFSGWIIEDNTTYNNGNSGIHIMYNGVNCTIRRNTVYQNCTSNGNFGAGIKLFGNAEYIAGMKVYDNKVYSNGLANKSGNQGDGVGIWFDGCKGTSGNPNLVYNNLIYDNGGNGIFFEISEYCYASGNVLVDNAENLTGDDEFTPANIVVDARGEGSTRYYSRYCRVYNNSCYGGRGGLKLASYDNVGSTVHLLNNEFKNNITSGASEHEFVGFGGGTNDSNGSGNVVDNNCLGSESSNFIQWGAGEYFSTYDAWETEHGKSWVQIEGNPLYTNPSSRDLTLQATSPCKDTGDNLGSSYDEGLLESSIWPNAVTTADQDFYGGSWEVGAYIYSGGGSSSTPTPTPTLGAPSPTPTRTPTYTPTSTPVGPTNTPTPTWTPTRTPTRTSTRPPTSTPVGPTNTPTPTWTPVVTTATPTPRTTPIATPTRTSAPAPTQTPPSIPSSTPTPTPTRGIDDPPSNPSVMVTLPVVAHIQGVGGTPWRSDVSISSRDSIAQQLRFVYLSDKGKKLARTRILKPHSTLLLKDLVRNFLGGEDGKGPLRIEVLTEGSKPPSVISRTYAAREFGNLGSGLPADVEAATGQFTLPGLIHGTYYRSSVAVLAGPNADVSVYFRLYRGLDGGVTGLEKRVIKAETLQQWSIDELFPGEIREDQTMTVNVILSQPGIAFSTLVDNASTDSTVFLGKRPSTSWIVPVVAHVPGKDDTLWSSTVTLWNASSSVTEIRLEYLPENTDNSSGGITASPFLLGSYDTLSLEDVLRTRFGITNGKGVLVIEGTKPISASARVWTAGPQGGSAGNGVRAVHSSSMSAGETVLPGVRMRDGFRSNVGVVTGNAWTTLEFRLRDGDGILLGKEFVEVPPRTLTQLSLNNLFGNNVGKPDPAGSLVVVGSDRYIAYLTVIDGSSQDPVFIMPQ
jgi:hypothetical protein